MTAVKDAAVLAKYVALRRDKEQIEADTKAKLKPINDSMLLIEKYLKQIMDDRGITQIKSDKFGTAFLTTTDYANVENWDSLLEFVISNERYEMLQKSVTKTAVREYIQEHKAVPPGVSYGTKIDVSIRKPTIKAED
jgi:hypothetical protein